MTEIPKDAWAGLADVRPVSGNDIFDGAPGAFSNVVARAPSALAFQRLVEEFFASRSLTLVSLDRIRRVAEVAEVDQVSRELVDLANSLADSNSETVAYDNFFVYENDE